MMRTTWRGRRGRDDKVECDMVKQCFGPAKEYVECDATCKATWNVQCVAPTMVMGNLDAFEMHSDAIAACNDIDNR